MKLLTIAVPTYNRIIDCERTVCNIAEQIVKYNLEEEVQLLVSDNCSTDGTYEMLENLKSKYGKFVEIYHQTNNLGMGGNFDFVLQKTDSEYIQVCSDDDLYKENMVLKTVKILKNKNPDHLFLNCYVPDWKKSYVTLEKDFEGNLDDSSAILRCYSPHISPNIIRTSLIKDLPYMHPEWLYWEKFMQMSKSCKSYISAKAFVVAHCCETEKHWLEQPKLRDTYHFHLLEFCTIEKDSIKLENCRRYFLKNYFNVTGLKEQLDICYGGMFYKLKKYEKYKKRLQILYIVIPILSVLIIIETLILLFIKFL